MFTEQIQNKLRQTLLKMGFEPDPDFESSDPDKPCLICYSPYIEIYIDNDGGLVFDECGQSFDYYYPEDTMYLTNDGKYDEEFFIEMVKHSKELLLQREIKKDFE